MAFTVASLMPINEFKSWHWIVIGIIVGIALASVRLSFPVDERDGAAQHISVARFVEKLHAAPLDGRPALRRIVVHPPRQRDTEDGPRRVHYVMGELLGANGTGGYAPFALYAETPFRPSRSATAPHANYSVLHFLADANRAGLSIDYRYGWWETPRMIIALWGGGSVLLIGGIWPIVLNVLIGAGFGAKQAEEAEDDLSRFGAGKAEAKRSAPAPQTSGWDLTEEEIAQLGAIPAAAPEQPSRLAVKRLASDAVTEPPPPTPDGPHEYRGEFYPVEKPTKAPGDRE